MFRPPIVAIYREVLFEGYVTTSIYVTSEATTPNQHTPYTFFKTDTNTVH